MSWVRSRLQLGRSSKLPPRFQEVRWRSRALRKRMAFALYLPPGYHEQREMRYPVLYLLHGSGHDRHSVLSEVRPQERTAQLGESMLVIPDGDQGWWLDSPMLPRSRYGQYVLELVEFVDRQYRTVASRAARGICGFSMGGHGAMLLAAQHPQSFGAASSLLGPLDIVQMFPDYYRLGLLLGPDRDTWQRFSPAHWAENLARTALQFCTAEEATDRRQNEAFAAVLQSLHIPFEFNVYPGVHDTVFVRKHIGELFGFHRRAFDESARG
jgi:S-formylglutathione hydrolase FrmB